MLKGAQNWREDPQQLFEAQEETFYCKNIKDHSAYCIKNVRGGLISL